MTATENALIEETLNRHMAETFRSDAARESWLRSPNPMLDGKRPLDLLASGELRRVDEALEAMNSGVYI